MDREQARRQWDSAAPGWARWEPVIGRWLTEATEAMLDAAEVRPGVRVLDIACGAGDQTLAAARRTGPSGYVLATDISEEMIGHVGQQARSANLQNVEARRCAAQDLEPGESPFDSAICRLGLMLIPAPHTVVRSVLGALRPHGRLGAIVFSSPAANPFMSKPLEILRRHANKPTPASGGPGIFALSDAAALKALLEDAGFIDVSIRTIDETLQMASAADAVQMMQDAFGVYRAIIGDQPPDTQKAAWTEVLDFVKSFEGSAGFRVPAQFHIVGAIKPSS
jgi:ubiquinone/menaquinone biosynthesis C-methylase UbiE